MSTFRCDHSIIGPHQLRGLLGHEVPSARYEAYIMQPSATAVCIVCIVPGMTEMYRMYEWKVKCNNDIIQDLRNTRKVLVPKHYSKGSNAVQS